MTDDEWVKVAMVEDAVVAELLTSFKDTNKTTAPPSTSTPARPALSSFEWRVRQRRSKGVLVVPTKKKTPTASPTTPLSWSGATSISGGQGGRGGGGGCAASGSGRGFEVEESSQLSAPKITDMTRSKVSGSCEVSTAKKCRKKKVLYRKITRNIESKFHGSCLEGNLTCFGRVELQTLTQLREEEVLLERERRQLKRELDTVRDNLERERTRNENFKRMKQQAVSFKPISMTLVGNHGHGLIHQSSQNGCREGKMETTAGKYELPDLNLPLEENHCGL